MNAKTAKKIRKLLKSEGIDVRHATYDLNERVISLSDTCGRKLYKRAKSLNA